MFESLWLVLVVSITTVEGILLHDNVARCPGRDERRLLSRHQCITGKYHCLQDDEKKLVETCNNEIQLPPGSFPRYASFADRIIYDPCPEDRYQPWPVKSYEIARCELVKSSCDGIGQVPCEAGSTTTDATCGCDYKSGFVLSGSSKCCSPSGSADCFCEYRPCDKDSQELNSDYVCVDKCMAGYERPPMKNECVLMPNDTSPVVPFTESTFITTTLLPASRPTVTSKTSVLTVIIIGFVSTFFLLIAIAIVGEVRRPYKYQLIPFVIFFVILVGCQIFVTIQVLRDVYLPTAVIAISIMGLVIIIGVCYGLYLLLTHDVVKEKIYNENYDVQIFKLLNAAANGNVDEMKIIRNQRLIDLHDTDYDKRSALHLAACEGQYKAVKYLLDYNAGYPKAKDRCTGRTAAEEAEWHKNLDMNKKRMQDFDKIITILDSYTHGPVQKKSKDHFRDKIALQLIKAAENGEEDILQSHLTKGTDMNLCGSDGQTALHAAAEKEQEDIVNFLLDKCKVSPFARYSGKRPSELLQNSEASKRIKKKLSEEMTKCSNCKPECEEDLSLDVFIVRLLNSASRGDIKRIKSLHTNKYSMAEADYDKRTALHIAVTDNQEYVVEYLLRDCNLTKEALTLKDRWQNTPLMLAREGGKGKIFRLFLQYCPNVVNTESDEYKTFKLLMAGSKGDIETLKRLYESGIDMNMQDYDGRTALHLYATSENCNKEDMKNLVIDCNCNMYLTDRYGRTAVSELKDHMLYDEFVKHIEDDSPAPHSDFFGHRLETKTVKNRTSGQKIFSYKKQQQRLKSITSKSKDHKQPTQVTNRSNLYIMYEAAAKGDTETLKECEYPYFDIGDHLGNTPLHIAAAKGHLEVVRYLLDEHHVSPFIRNIAMKRPIDLVNDQIKFVVNREGTKENIDQRRTFSETRNYLEKAMKGSIKKAMEDRIKSHEMEKDPSFTLLDQEAQIFMLLNKTFKGDIESVKRYVTSNKEILNKTNYDQRTALHIAVAEGHAHLVEYFLKQPEIDITIKDRRDQTAKDEAKANALMESLKKNKSEDSESDISDDFEKIEQIFKEFFSTRGGN